MAEDIEKRLAERCVKSSLNMIVLAMLNGKPMHGYNIIGAIHKEFGILLSPGSLYPLLHMLEDDKLIESRFNGGKINGGKIIYQVTSKGKIKLANILITYKTIVRRVSNLMEPHPVLCVEEGRRQNFEEVALGNL